MKRELKVERNRKSLKPKRGRILIVDQEVPGSTPGVSTNIFSNLQKNSQAPDR